MKYLKQDQIKSQCIKDPHMWPLRGGNEFINLDLSYYGISQTISELRLINFFKY